MSTPDQPETPETREGRPPRRSPPRDLPPAPAERPAAGVGDRLHAAAIHLLRWLREADRASPLPAARLSALSVVVHRGPLSLKHLAAAEQVRPPTMSRIVGKLVDGGFVRRQRDPDDGRGVRIRATARGRRVLEEGRRRRMELLEKALGRLDPAGREALAAGVEVIERLVPGGDGAGSGGAQNRKRTPKEGTRGSA